MRRIDPPARGQAGQIAQAMAASAVTAPPPPTVAPGEFTATQVINSMGREPETWEAGIDGAAHRMRVPVPDLAGYVVSRIGTPKASTRRTIEIPVRATHMDTLMPQDFLLEVDFRGPGAVTAAHPAVSARREAAGPNRAVPMSWFIGSVGIFVVVLALLVALILTRMG